MRGKHVFTWVGAVALVNWAVVTTRELFVVFFVIMFEVQMGLNAEVTCENVVCQRAKVPVCEWTLSIEAGRFVRKVNFALDRAQHVTAERAVTDGDMTLSFARFLCDCRCLFFGRRCRANCDVVAFPEQDLECVLFFSQCRITSSACVNRQNLRSDRLSSKTCSRIQCPASPDLTTCIASMYMWIDASEPVHCRQYWVYTCRMTTPAF